jgi:hypothetical protein
MNRSTMWLALAAAWLALRAAAAPVPAVGPESQGPITDALRLRDKLPATAPPTVMKVALRGDDIEVERRLPVYVPITREVNVERDGKVEKVTQTTYVPSAVVRQETVPVKGCKFFRVTNEGKLETLDVKKAAAMLQKEAPVLTGDRAEVDPKYLERVKPGTLYLVLPPRQELPPQPAPPPPKKSRVDDN